MKTKSTLLLVLGSAVILTFLFYRQSLGLNLFLAETGFMLWLYLTKQFKFKRHNLFLSGSGLLITGLFTIITHSAFSYLANLLAVAMFIGILIYPEAKSWINSLNLSFQNIFKSQKKFLTNISDSEFIGHRMSRFLHNTRIVFLPLIIIILFVGIYSNANPIFGDAIQSIETFIYKKFFILFGKIDFSLPFTFIFCLAISNYIFIRLTNDKIILRDSISGDELVRKKKKKWLHFSSISLKYEYRAAIFLFLILNILLLMLNSIDIYWVWFNFKWNGQYLKQFVHEGTYLLILSILISITLVLYFFRDNLNFYPKNNALKNLSYIWIIQNAVLTISVAIRNMHYIEYFNLAYKRIGIFLFLLLTIYGLYTVLLKIYMKKSSFFIFRKNTFSIYIVITLSSLFNWDSIIAKYNFSHADRSFLHLNYMVNLSNKSLPVLDKPLQELLRIDSIQRKKFPFEITYLGPVDYHDRIQKRKALFKNKWESKHVLSWNLPEYLAYKKLFKDSAPDHP